MPVDELAALLRVVTLIADLDPANAWELDAQLDGLAKVSATFAEGLGTWGERLAEIGLHDSVTASAATGSDHLTQTAAVFAGARQNLRTVYAAQFAAAEAQVSQVERRDFWGETPTAGPGQQASAGIPAQPAGDEPAGDEPAEAEVQSGAMNLPSGEYLDWSLTLDEGGRSIELSDGTDAVVLEFNAEKLADLHRLLGLALADDGPTQYFLGGLNPDREGPNQYMEWGAPLPDGGRQLEFGEGGGDSVTIDLTRDELQALHDQLAEDIAAEQDPAEAARREHSHATHPFLTRSTEVRSIEAEHDERADLVHEGQRTPAWYHAVTARLRERTAEIDHMVAGLRPGDQVRQTDNPGAVWTIRDTRDGNDGWVWLSLRRIGDDGVEVWTGCRARGVDIIAPATDDEYAAEIKARLDEDLRNGLLDEDGHAAELQRLLGSAAIQDQGKVG